MNGVGQEPSYKQFHTNINKNPHAMGPPKLTGRVDPKRGHFENVL